MTKTLFYSWERVHLAMRKIMCVCRVSLFLVLLRKVCLSYYYKSKE